MLTVRYTFLDSARGIAALIVVIHHYFLEYGNFSFDSTINIVATRFFSDGMSAVRFFFVLSGFVLSLSLLKSDDKLTPAKYFSFVVSRVFRIMPLYIFVLLLSILSYFLLYKNLNFVPNKKFFFGTSWSDPHILKNVWREFLLYINLERTYGFIPQGWSLTYEIINSFFLPFLLIIVRYQKILSVIFVFILLKFFQVNEFIFDFYLGVIIAQNHQIFTFAWLKLSTFWKSILSFMSISLFAINTILPPYLPYYFEKFFFSLTSVGSALIILILIASPKSQAILNKKIMYEIGRFSFSIYLTHILVINALVPYLFTFINTFTLNYNLNLALGLFCTLFISLMISFVLFYIVEKPFIKIGKSALNLFQIR